MLKAPGNMVDAFYQIIKSGDVNEFINKFNCKPNPGFVMQSFDYFLDHVVGTGDLSTMKILVENFSFDVRYKDNLAIKFCAGTKNLDMMEYLIKAGANVNPYPTDSQISLLGKALSIKFNYHMVKLLLESGSDPNSSSGSVFARACTTNCELVEQFIERGADVRHNQKAFINAVDYQKLDIVKLLIEHGANVQMQNNAALKLAMRKNNTKLVTLLVNNGASINKSINYAAEICA